MLLGHTNKLYEAGLHHTQLHIATPVHLLAQMPPKSYVTLISTEGYEFVIDYKAACVSNTIRNMLSSSGQLSACAV